ncbi:MAG: hypothetical protein CMH83_11030 [Nocardioides sp.]|nr:hypothetical protein [Nocardioides sp.]
MNADLREELDRLGDTAPVVDVDAAAVWQRGRRARRREAGLAVAAAAAAVALVAGLVAWLPTDDGALEPAGSREGLGVPAEVHLPDSPRRDVEPAPDLAVGTTAAVLVTSDTATAVAVDATSGGYRRLALPGLVDGNLAQTDTVRLSPDGTRLVYTYADGAEDGLGLVDLLTGELRQVPLPGSGDGVLVRTISPSPNGDWFVWSAQRREGSGFRGEVAGLVDWAAGTSDQLVTWGERQRAFGVGDDGTVWYDDAGARLVPMFTRSLEAFRPLPDDHRWAYDVHVGGPGFQDVAQVRAWSIDEAAPVAPALLRGTGDTRDIDLPDGAMPYVVGWVGDDPVLVPTGDTADTTSAVVRVAPAGSLTQALSLIGAAPYRVTIATDLLADGAVERPTPSWADYGTSWWRWAIGGGAAVLLLLGAGVVVRRRRP